MIRFDFDEYNGAVKELETQGSPLFTDSTLSKPMILKANGHSQTLRYRLLSPQETYFLVDSASGSLRVAEPIKFEMVCLIFIQNFLIYLI